MKDFIRKYFFSTEAGLQMRMTLWVVGMVSVVATIVMLIASSVLRDKYEESVRNDLVNDMDHIVTILEQRMKRMEYITYTTASIFGTNLDDYNSHELDSAICGLMKDVECVDMVALLLANENDNDSCVTVHYTYNTLEGGKRTLESESSDCADVRENPNWIASYHQGRELWCTPSLQREYVDQGLQSFSVPVYTPDSVCRGMLTTIIYEKFISDMVVKYKTRLDIDVSIYNSDGICLVEPDDYILELSPDQLLTEERFVERLNWRMVFSVDYSVIKKMQNDVVVKMLLSIIVLLVSLALSIVLTVRYVARPFMMRQRQMAETNAAMERELQIAAETQRQLVPHTFPPFPDRHEFDISACLYPAREVGGDLYDYFIHQDKLYFCIGDVSGKGAPASLFMAATHYLFRSVASVMPMAEAVGHINRSLCIDNEKCNFVTFFFACLNLKNGMLQYCNAGHNPPILVHDGEPRYFAQPDGMPLGVWDEAEYDTCSIQLCHGDTLLLYTDGVTEAMNSSLEEFGNDNTLKCVAECQTLEPQSIIDVVLSSVRQHAGTAQQSDDITMLCIKLCLP